MQQNETQQSVLSTVQQEMASRRNKISCLTKQDSRLSVKSLIETIENNKQVSWDHMYVFTKIYNNCSIFFAKRGTTNLKSGIHFFNQLWHTFF